MIIGSSWVRTEIVSKLESNGVSCWNWSKWISSLEHGRLNRSWKIDFNLIDARWETGPRISMQVDLSWEYNLEERQSILYSSFLFIRQWIWNLELCTTTANDFRSTRKIRLSSTMHVVADKSSATWETTGWSVSRARRRARRSGDRDRMRRVFLIKRELKSRVCKWRLFTEHGARVRV